MILAAALLVLVALALFVGGIATGTTALYWSCVAVSALAAVLLVVARRQLGRSAGESADRAADLQPTHRSADPAGRHGAAAEPEPAAADPGSDTGEPVPLQEAAASRSPQTAGSAEFAGMATASPRHEFPGDDPRGHADGPDPAGRPDRASAAGAHRRVSDTSAAVAGAGDPPVEEVEVTDLLLIVDLHDDVYVVDEHPRYHLADCPYLRGRTAIPLPMDEARTDGFTPCATCAPDRHLADVERARRAERGAS